MGGGASKGKDGTSEVVCPQIAPGTKVPEGELHDGFPPSIVKIHERLAGKKIILVGLPGAFTPC
jgi:2-Cys peroxiredoxin 5